MTDLTPDQITERENARQSNGEFGTHEHSAPELGLVRWDASEPLLIRVRLERWTGKYDVEVGVAEFDARAIFDGRSVADLERAEDSEDLDWVFEEAKELGLSDHDGAYTVELPEDFGDYLRHREGAGMTGPYPSAAASKAILALEKRQEVLAAAERLLTIAGEHGTIAKKAGEIERGDVLVKGSHRFEVLDVYDSTATPGIRHAETEFGTLALDPDVQFQVERL